jgi:hypothetical protein
MELLISTESYKPNETGIVRAEFSTCSFTKVHTKVKTKPALNM